MQPETRTFYCQVDTYQGRKDYLRGGRCVRLVGVEQSDYTRLMQDELKDGVTTFVVDLDVPSFLRKAQSKVWNNRFHDEELAFLELQLDEEPVWYKISVDVAETGYSYFYPTFSALPPTYFTAKTVRPVEAPCLPVKPLHTDKLLGFMQATRAMPSPREIAPGYEKLNFSAFHVGQGMCSIVHDRRHGVMFDAGAGKPVTRELYLAGLEKNELQSLVQKLESIPYFVLSHFDNDHWNMLAWDQSLRDSVEQIIVPNVKSRSSRSVAFFDIKIKDKVVEASTVSIQLSDTSLIEIRRSNPSASDSNGHCLVSHIQIEKKLALAAGDYVYSRMKTDTGPLISAWNEALYSAVIVPHHGDEASSHNIPGCDDDAVAFFSAGTHKTWGHPNDESINRHKRKGFRIIEDHAQENIIRKVLI
jgi:beta-lactamase superfamily II metal-dependent hydrolase